MALTFVLTYCRLHWKKLMLYRT